MLLPCYRPVWVIKSCYYHLTTRFGLLSEVITMLPPGLGYEVMCYYHVTTMKFPCYHQVWVNISHVITMLPPGLGD